MQSNPSLARRMTAQYASLQGAYWMVFCAVMSFASAFLLSRDFDNTQIGVVLALSNVFGALLQPAAASLADRARRFSLRQITAAIAFAAAALSGVLLAIPHSFWLTAVLFCLVATAMLTVQPLINALGFVYERWGLPIDFGLARGIGSLCYAAVSFLLGLLLERWGADVLPVGFVLLYLLIALLALTFRAKGLADAPAAKAAEEGAGEGERPSSLLEFFRQNPRFTLFLAGATCVFVFHTMLNNFLMQIVVHAGGQSADFGAALTVALALELPTMALFSRLVRRVRCETLLKISLGFFLVKAVLLFVARDPGGVYLSQVFQVGGFALFTPAAVHHANAVIAGADRVKGQAMLAVTNTLGGVFGSLLGGWLIDRAGIPAMLLFGVGITALGGAVAWLALGRAPAQKG
ncbi:MULTISPECIES: MFS transporter [Eubacteriales]|uniref:MFS transporter n=1 Tax=Bittarella massiliensis (ex Durand et al. 2017) TaxID=1720313 RepID=A0AAQ1MEF6_9FIRM|nr:MULTISPECIES: MFS transporter [Eubacteriales]MZL70448.1 MFS transporter [Bittarella massiliensis (ex Durand et al. 2017)]MZL80319.1 MFS transporter [Bittarella massiliensis (ex Durand et al. 2017)]SHG33731.1 MFS transporter, PPP family, 3-phenylpropionic acid transporter [Bittarella massiliensis (ex Durand et al. 2017)]